MLILINIRGNAPHLRRELGEAVMSVPPDVSPTRCSMLQPAFRLQSPEKCKLSPTLLQLLNTSATTVPAPPITYYACQHGSHLKPFLPNVCPRAMRRSHSMQTLFRLTRGRLAARRHHLSYAALPLRSRVAQDGGSRRRCVLHGMTSSI